MVGEQKLMIWSWTSRTLQSRWGDEASVNTVQLLQPETQHLHTGALSGRPEKGALNEPEGAGQASWRAGAWMDTDGPVMEGQMG